MREAIAAVLPHPAYTVATTGSAGEALALCASHDPDIVLVDLSQAAQEEADLLSVLRRQRPATATIALVPRSTGLPGGDAGRVAEADATVHTPFDASTLLDAVERVLGAD